MSARIELPLPHMPGAREFAFASLHTRCALQPRKENPMSNGGSRFLYVTYIRTTPEKLWQALTTPESAAMGRVIFGLLAIGCWRLAIASVDHDVRALQGDQSAADHLVELGQNRLDLLFALDAFDYEGEVGREPQDLFSVDPG